MKKHSGGMGLTNPHKSGISHSKGSSMPQGTATGSGSRPGKGKTTMMSSAPADARTLGRAPKGYMK